MKPRFALSILVALLTFAVACSKNLYVSTATVQLSLEDDPGLEASRVSSILADEVLLIEGIAAGIVPEADRHVEVRPMDSTALISISVRFEDPLQAERYANQISQLYVDGASPTRNVRILERAVVASKPSR